MTTWMSIPGFPSYLVSECGRVKRLGSDTDKIAVERCGYLFVGLWERGKFTNIGVHRLVALAFIGPKPSPAHQVAHWDGVRSHNEAKNLRYATPKENQSDRRRHGTILSGERNAAAKLNIGQVGQIRGLLGIESQRSLAKRYGVSQAAISAISNGRNWPL